MTYEVRISDQAKNDIVNIFRYITFSLFSVENAETQLIKLKNRIEGLKDMPFRFQILETNEPMVHVFRKMVVGNYLVIYHIDEERLMVNVLRVIYGRQDLDAELEKGLWADS